MAVTLERVQASLADRYRVERMLGCGGMGAVFLAYDLKHHRQIALKVLDPDLAAVLGPERFLREIDTLGALTHPHIVPLFDSGGAQGLLYYAMALVEGEPLRARLERERQLPLDDALRIARQVADALDYAHRHGVVHRDIKPENVLLQEQHALVADFGIARAIEAAGGARLTGSGVVLGTPVYMSPEQTAGGAVDGRSDLYALGCLLHEMLAGQPPFNGPTAASIAYQHLNAAPPRVTQVRPAVPEPVERAITKALAKSPADRYQTGAQMAAALAHVGEPAGAPAPAGYPAPTPEPRPAPGPKPGARPRPRLRRALVIAPVAVAALALAAWIGVRNGWLPAPGRGPDTTGVAPVRKIWTFVAEFDGPAADPSVAAAARSLLCEGLDQSQVIASVPRDQVRLALELAGKPETTRVSSDLARELAYRSAVRTVVEGRVDRVGGRFPVVVRVVDVEGGRQVLSLSDVARSEDALIPTMTRLGQRLARGMAANAGAVVPRRDFDPQMTPSLEAYRLSVEVGRLVNDEGDYDGALRLSRRALELDSAYASIWEAVAICYRNRGRADSATWAIRQGLRHPERLTPAQRLLFETDAAWDEGDIEQALAACDQTVRLYPNDPVAGYALNRIEVIMATLGRLEEALACNTRNLEFTPVTPDQVSLQNRLGYLLALGRLDEARAVANRLRGWMGRQAALDVAVAERAWARVESLAVAIEDDPRAERRLRGSAAGRRALVAAVRGEVGRALAEFRRARQIQARAGLARPAHVTLRIQTLLALAGGLPGPGPDRDLARDTTARALITRGYISAAASDTAAARRLLSLLRARSSTRKGVHGHTPEFLASWIAFRAGRWAEVLERIGEPARRGSDRGSSLLDRIGPAHEQWLVAQAFERLGAADSAAAYYELMLSPMSAGTGANVGSFVHQRLVVLYTRAGRLVDAERHLAILERDFTRPDPEVRHLLDEARTAVKAARGMTRAAEPRL